MRAISQAIRPFGLESQCRLCDGLGCPVCGEYRRARKNKFNAIKTVVDGITFDSKAESRRYNQLKLLERAGHIRQIELQPRFKFEIDGKLMFTYVADFAYFEGLSRIVEDCKGVRTPVYRIKKKIIEQAFKIIIREVA